MYSTLGPDHISSHFDLTSEVICNDEARQLQVESAEKLLEMLYDPISRGAAQLEPAVKYLLPKHDCSIDSALYR